MQQINGADTEISPSSSFPPPSYLDKWELLSAAWRRWEIWREYAQNTWPRFLLIRWGQHPSFEKRFQFAFYQNDTYASADRSLKYELIDRLNKKKNKKHIGQKCFRNSTKMKRGNLLPLKNQTGQKLVRTRVMYVIKNVRNKALTTSKFFEIIFPSWGLIPRWRIEINRLPNDSSNTLPTHNTAPQSY